MISHLAAVPNLSLLEVRMMSEEFGIQLGVLSNYTFKKYPPRRKLYFGPVKLVYVKGIRTLNNFLAPLVDSQAVQVILVNDSNSAFEEYNMEITSEFKGSDLRSQLVRWKDLKFEKFVKSKDFTLEIYQFYDRGSILKALQGIFYRVKDIGDRSSLQNKVFSYLGGVTTVLPNSGMPVLNKLLTSEAVMNFRKAVADARKTSADEASVKFSVDRFELQYILVRCGLT